MLPGAAWALSLLSHSTLTLESIPPLQLGWGRVLCPPVPGELVFFSRVWNYSINATYWWGTMAPGYPLSTWPKIHHCDADVTCTIPLPAVDAESHNVPGVQKPSCHPWWLLGIIAKVSHSFSAQGAKLPILSSNHWSNDMVAMSCLCEWNQQFLCPVHLSSGTRALFFPA